MIVYSKNHQGIKYSLSVIQKSDLDKLAGHRNDPETWGTLTHVLPVLPAQQDKWFENLNHDNMYFIADRLFDSVGLIRLNEIEWVNRSACIGVDIFKDHRGKGYGSGVFNLAVSYGFEVLNMHRLWLLVLESNFRARKIYEHAGFTEEGVMREHIYRNGKYHNYILMGMLESEYDTSV